MKPLLTEGTVRIGPVISIPDILREHGVDPTGVLEEAGVPVGLVDDPDNLIAFRDRSHLLGLCAQRTSCPHFGLLVGQRGNLSSFGLVGYLARHTRDVSAALRSLVQYIHLHTEGSMALLEEGDDLAFLGYGVYEERTEALDQTIEAAVAIIFNMLREICGTEWHPTEICFTRERPADLKPYRHFFKAPLRFGAEGNGVYFPSRWLGQEVHGADPELHRLLQKQVARLETHFRQEFPAQVRQVVRAALLTGHANIDYVAGLFSMHGRTLRRRLVAEETSFQEILSECRFEMARQLLETPELQCAQVAEMLGYSDHRAFSRAFRRWSGTTPSRWRARSCGGAAFPT